MSKPRHIPSPFFDGCVVLAAVVAVKSILVATMAHTAITQGLLS